MRSGGLREEGLRERGIERGRLEKRRIERGGIESGIAPLPNGTGLLIEELLVEELQKHRLRARLRVAMLLLKTRG